AARAVLVEPSAAHLEAALRRLSPQEGSVEILALPAAAAVRELARRGERFEVVFADPPYPDEGAAAAVSRGPPPPPHGPPPGPLPAVSPWHSGPCTDAMSSGSSDRSRRSRGAPKPALFDPPPRGMLTFALSRAHTRQSSEERECFKTDGTTSLPNRSRR